MSVRVNLLPQEVQARGQANRARVLAGVVGLAVLVVLAGLSFLQRGTIDDAEDRLAAVQADNEALRADISALQPFADLEARADGSVAVVASALGGEGSLATILQDLSAVMPPNGQIESLAITLPGEALTPQVGGDRLVYGRLAATGKVLDGLAPGIERLIIDLDRVASFDNVYVTSSTVDEEGVATFALEIELGPETLTRRYVVSDEEVTP